MDINFLNFSKESLLPEELQLTPLTFPQKLEYTQSNLVDEESSEESIPSILHHKIKVDTNITHSLPETTKYLIHSLILKVKFTRKCFQK